MSGISVTTYFSANSFLGAVEDSLSGINEWKNNIVLGVWRNYARTGLSEDQIKECVLCVTSEGEKLSLVAAKSPDYPPLNISSALDPSMLDVRLHVSRLVTEMSSSMDLSLLPMAFNGNRLFCIPLAEAMANMLSMTVKIERTLKCAVVSRDTFIAKPVSLLPDGHSIVNVDLRQQTEVFADRFIWMMSALRAEYGWGGNREAPSEVSPSFRSSALEVNDNGGLWAYVIQGETTPSAILSVGRESRNVYGITIVYTDKVHRRKGYAETLTREVVRQMLEDKECVVIFFHEGGEASRIYRKIGFGSGVGSEFDHVDLKVVPSTE